MLCFILFFFFKQKTAYEMPISDWSSDVCSSDLPGDPGVSPVEHGARWRPDHAAQSRHSANHHDPSRSAGPRTGDPRPDTRAMARKGKLTWPTSSRSEEHTSELQSLMRISYAVFCLKNKKKQKP